MISVNPFLTENTAEITLFTSDRYQYELGQNVYLDLEIAGTEENRDLSTNVIVKKENRDEAVAGLPIRELKNLQGQGREAIRSRNSLPNNRPAFRDGIRSH